MLLNTERPRIDCGSGMTVLTSSRHAIEDILSKDAILIRVKQAICKGDCDEAEEGRSGPMRPRPSSHLALGCASRRSSSGHPAHKALRRVPCPRAGQRNA